MPNQPIPQTTIQPTSTASNAPSLNLTTPTVQPTPNVSSSPAPVQSLNGQNFDAAGDPSSTPTRNTYAFNIDPTTVKNPQGQQFLQAFNYYAQNPSSPLASAFYKQVQNGTYNSQAQSAGIDLGAHQDIFKSVTSGQEALGQDKTDEANITSDLQKNSNGKNPWIPQNGTVPALDSIIQNVGLAAKETNDTLAAPRWSPLGWINDALGAVASGANKGVTALETPSATELGTTLRNIVGGNHADELGQEIVKAVNSPEGQKAIASYTPAIKDVGAVGDVANLAGTVAATQGVLEGTSDLAGMAKKALAPTLDSVASNAGLSGSLQDMAVKGEKSAWEAPTNSPKSSYNNANEVFSNAKSKGNYIPDTLLNNGIRLADNVDGGTYDTASSADQLRKDAGTMSREVLRPSLQMADYTTPKTPLSEINIPDDVIQAQGKGVTPDDMEAIHDTINKKLNSLGNKYPEGMGLTDMHDEKITYNENGKYSPVGDPSVNNNAIANRAIGSVLGDLVEQKAPEGIPVHEFNGELTKQYQAADYLDALDGKKVPQSLMGRIANTASKAIGATIGNHLGGGILGDVAGYHFGGMVENMLSSLPDTIRGHFLNNLEMTNPDAFNAIKEYMGNEKTAQLQRPQLPAPDNETPIPMGGRSAPPDTSGPVSPEEQQKFAQERASVASQNEKDQFSAQQEKEAQATKELQGKLSQSAYRSKMENLTNRFGSKENWEKFVNNNPLLIQKIQNAGTTPGDIWDLMNKPIPKVEGAIPETTAQGQKAVDLLKSAQTGEIKGAFNNPQIGKIDLVWGDTNDEGNGLSKIIQQHPEAVNKLDHIISNGKIVGGRMGRIYLETDNGYKAVIRTDYNDQPKNWLLTAYKKK